MSYEANKIANIDLINQDKEITNDDILRMFHEFLCEFKSDGESYFTRLENNKVIGNNSIKIKLEHINAYNEMLYYHFSNNALAILEYIEREMKIQIEILSTSSITKIRDIKSHKANKIARVEGIVISTSSVFTKPNELVLECRNCSHRYVTREVIPRKCQNNANGQTEDCQLDPYVVIPELCTVTDVQYVKIQESFEDIPMGETPRHFSLMLSNQMTNKVSPGSKAKFTGVLVVKGNKCTMHVLGVEQEKQKVKSSFSQGEEATFYKLLSECNQKGESMYELISKSIAPNIFGKEEVKRALACMLFGGTRKTKEDGISLRGDINVLLLGDPGIAKSQFLKFMEMVSPISVYTSGRGSSAAGLTASVIKDKHSRGFYLEGGALVLADRGICCIDEFDKMGESDRVAIHEAMEQQTVSIAKAGITTVLNTRTAILAAANPVFGRYDDYKTPAENIEFGSTILSRFDMIFILKDAHSEADKETAKHVLNVHTRGAGENAEESETNKKNKTNILNIEMLRNYVQYAKTKVNPVLSEEAANKLSRFYVSIRQQVDEFEKESSKRSSVPITVRQLESLIRISESMARMDLSSVVNCSHVEEAIRLFQVSTMNAVSQGHQIEGMTRNSWLSAMTEVVEKIREHLPIGTSKKASDLLRSIRVEEKIFKRTVDYMIKQNKLVSRDQGKILVRVP